MERRSFLRTVSGTSVIALAGCAGAGRDTTSGDSEDTTSEDSGDAGGGSDGSGSQDETTWNLGTSSDGSGAFQLGNVLSTIFAKNSDQLSVSPQTTEGYTHNLRLMNQGELEAGFAFTNNAFDMYNDSGPFEEQPIENKPVTALPTIHNVLHMFFVKRDTDIKTVEDLAGGRVTMGSPGSTIPDEMEALLEAHGVLNEVETVPMSWDEASTALRSNEVDAVTLAFLSLRFNQTTQELAQTTDIDFVVPTEDGLSNFFDLKPAFSEYTFSVDNPMLPSSIDSRHDGKITTQAIRDVGMVRRDQPEDLVYHALKTIHENQSQVTELSPTHWGYGFGDVEVEGNTYDRFGISGVEGVPFHPGAERFLKEIDVWQDDWESM